VALSYHHAATSALTATAPEWPRGAHSRGGRGGPDGAAAGVPRGESGATSLGARGSARERAINNVSGVTNAGAVRCSVVSVTFVDGLRFFFFIGMAKITAFRSALFNSIFHQIRTRCSGDRYSFSPGFTSKAPYHASRFRTVLARYSGGAWASNRTPPAFRCCSRNCRSCLAACA